MRILPGLCLAWLLAAPAMAEETVREPLERQYLESLDGWVAGGGAADSLQAEVVEPCEKLVFIHASPSERAAAVDGDEEAYGSRVVTCVRFTENRVRPQPAFADPDAVATMCGGAALFRTLCARAGLD